MLINNKRQVQTAVLSILLTLVYPFSTQASSDFLSEKLWARRIQSERAVKPGIPPEVALLPIEMQKLPLGIQAWFVYETDYLSRAVDPNRILPPTQNDQNPFYSPEAKNIFNLVGVWLRENELKVNAVRLGDVAFASMQSGTYPRTPGSTAIVAVEA